MRSVIAFFVALGVASGADIQVDFNRRHSSAAAQRRAARLDALFETASLDGANGTYPQQVNNFGDISYVGNISIGSPPQNFTVDFDTGSPDFFVPHTHCGYFGNCGGECHQKNVTADRCQEEFQCPADICSGKPYALPPESCAGLRGFDAAKSSTYKKDGKAWLIDYGIGSASGFTGFETVRLGDAQSLLVNNYNFGLATCLDPQFNGGPNDGMFGLSPGPTDTAGEKKTVLDVAYEQGHLDQPVFTAWLEEKGDVENVRAGVYTFGGVDTEHCGPVIDYRPVTLNNKTQAYDWWKFDVEGVSLGDYQAEGKLQFSEAISDSGTTLILVTMPYVKHLVEKAGAQYDKDADTYPITCDATFDPLTFTIGVWEYFVDHKQLIIKDPKFPFMCFLGIAELKVLPGEKAPCDFLLGDPWVRQYCQVHDFKQKRIGFAVAMP